MGWRDDAKQVTGIGNPAAGQALEVDIVKQLIEAEKATPDALGQFFDRQKGRTTQNLLGEMQSVNTGNPLTDQQIRETMLKDRGMGLYDMEKLNTAMPLMEAAGHKQYEQDVSTTDKIRTQRNQLADRTQLQELPDFNDPNFKGAAEARIKSNRVEGLITPGVDARYLEHFKAHPFALKTDEKHPTYPKVPTAILNAVGVDNFNDPSKYTTKARDQVINTIADNIGIQYPGITDRKVLKARAVELLALDPAGRKFDLRIADEAKETYGSVEMDKHSATLATSMGNVAGMSLAKGNTPAEMKAASQAVTKDMNAIFTHMKKFGVSPEQRARIMPSIMQALATTDLVEGSGRRAGFGEARRVLESIYNAEDRAKGLQPNGAARVQAALDGKITVGTQSKLKQALRRIYQDRFKNNIPNKILDQQVDTILNEDKTMSAAMTTGTKDAAEAAKYRENLSTSRRRSREEQAEVLDRMRGYGAEGTPLNVIYNDTLAKLKKDGWDGGAETDRDKLKLQLQAVYRKIGGLFSRHNTSPAFPAPHGNELTSEGREAFLLAARRMFVNNTGIQQPHLGGATRILGDKADFSLTRLGKDMDGDDELMLLEKLYENLPLPDRSQPDIKDGLTTFKEKLTNEIDILRDAKKRLMNQTPPNPYQYKPIVPSSG